MNRQRVEKGSASVYVRQGKAYVVTRALISTGDYAGMYKIVEPVFTVSLEIDELSQALERVIGAGLQEIPSPSREEMMHPDNKKDPLLRAARVGSWRKLYQGCAAYGVTLYEDELELTFWKPEQKGRGFIPDTYRFSPGTDIKEIAKAILDDARSRPELTAPPEAPEKPRKGG